MTDTDPEVERIAYLMREAHHEVATAWLDTLTDSPPTPSECWDAVARAVIADRTAHEPPAVPRGPTITPGHDPQPVHGPATQPTAPGWSTLDGGEDTLDRIAAGYRLSLTPSEAAALRSELDRVRDERDMYERERDAARRELQQRATDCDNAVVSARRERDAARTRAVSAEADRDALRAQLHDQAREAHALVEQGREAERAAISAREMSGKDIARLSLLMAGSEMEFRSAWDLIRDALLASTVQEVPEVPPGEWTPERVVAFNAPHPAPNRCVACGREVGPPPGWHVCGPQRASEPTLSPADVLSGAEEMLRRIAASACLDLDATEAGLLVAELDRLRALCDEVSAQNAMVRHERDEARDRVDQSLALIAALQAERDAARAKLGTVNARLYEVEAERDAARNLLTDAETREGMQEALANDLQRCLDALATREPNDEELEALRDSAQEAATRRSILKRDWRLPWIVVRDALLAEPAQEPIPLVLPPIEQRINAASAKLAAHERRIESLEARQPVVPTGEWTPERVAAFDAPHHCLACGREVGPATGWHECGPRRAAEPVLSPADGLDGAEEMLRRIAASAGLYLDATEAGAIVAELDRLRALCDEVSAQNAMVRHERDEALRSRVTDAETRSADVDRRLVEYGWRAR